MDKIKILHLITSLNIGGTEKFLLSVLGNLNRKYDFSVGYLKQRGQIAGEIEKLGIPVKKFSFFSLVQHLKNHKIRIIHTHLYRANIIGRIAAKLAGVPVIISSQRSIDGWKKFYHVWDDKCTSYFCDLIISNSEASKNILVRREKIPPGKITVVYNGIAPHKNTRTQEHKNAFTVAYIGRLHKEKGICLIPEIAKLVSAKNNKITFLIYGDGPERQNLELRIKQLGLETNIIFAGWKNDLENIYNSIDLLLLPSEEESFPQAALEAMSFGIPVMAADVGGVSELVENKKTGFLIKSREPEPFAEAILSLGEDRYCYNHFSENSKARAADFTLEKMINSIDGIYERFIRK